MRPPRGGGGFRGRDGGRGSRGAGGRFGSGGGRFGGGGRGGGFRDEGPPSEVIEVETFVHACEGDAVTKLTNEKIPYFSAPIYLQNKMADWQRGAPSSRDGRGGGRGEGCVTHVVLVVVSEVEVLQLQEAEVHKEEVPVVVVVALDRGSQVGAGFEILLIPYLCKFMSQV
ncbi:hypothetical protein QQ045_028073 [Rhodiola kirilowii]